MGKKDATCIFLKFCVLIFNVLSSSKMMQLVYMGPTWAHVLTKSLEVMAHEVVFL